MYHFDIIVIIQRLRIAGLIKTLALVRLLRLGVSATVCTMRSLFSSARPRRLVTLDRCAQARPAGSRGRELVPGLAISATAPLPAGSVLDHSHLNGNWPLTPRPLERSRPREGWSLRRPVTITERKCQGGLCAQIITVTETCASPSRSGWNK